MNEDKKNIKNNMICDDCKCGFRREEKEIARLNGLIANKK